MIVHRGFAVTGVCFMLLCGCRSNFPHDPMVPPATPSASAHQLNAGHARGAGANALTSTDTGDAFGNSGSHGDD
jgi:hypothetical protein